jgi:hypothetical protein
VPCITRNQKLLQSQGKIELALAECAAATERKAAAEDAVVRLTADVARLRWRTAAVRVIAANHARAVAHLDNVREPSQRHGLEHQRAAHRSADAVSALESEVSALEAAVSTARADRSWRLAHDLDHLRPLLTAVGVVAPIAHPTAKGDSARQTTMARIVARDV